MGKVAEKWNWTQRWNLHVVLVQNIKARIGCIGNYWDVDGSDESEREKKENIFLSCWQTQSCFLCNLLSACRISSEIENKSKIYSTLYWLWLFCPFLYIFHCTIISYEKTLGVICSYNERSKNFWFPSISTGHTFFSIFDYLYNIIKVNLSKKYF